MTEDARVGRPPVGPRIALRIPQELIDRLDDAADQHNTTRSDLLREGARMILDDLTEQDRDD